MAHETITFGGGLAFSGAQTVYKKARWADPWVEDPELFATHVTWSAQPMVPVATLYRNYGPVLENNTVAPTVRERLDIAGWFVKVVVHCEDGDRKWWGYVDAINEDVDGNIQMTPEDEDDDGLRPVGRQFFQCLHVINTLAHTLVTKTPFAYQSEDLQYGDCGPIFNEIVDGNKWPIRSQSINKVERPIEGQEEPEGGWPTAYVFDPVGVYDRDTEPRGSWTTRDILEHLVIFHAPLDKDGNTKIPFGWTGLEAIAGFKDFPTLESDQQSLLSLFDRLCTGRLMLGYSATVREPTEEELDDDPDALETIILEPFTMLTSPVDFDTETIPANDTTLDITYYQDQTTSVSLNLDLSTRANQVICRGAKQITVCTLPFCKSAYQDHPAVFEQYMTADELTPEPEAGDDPYINSSNRLEWLNKSQNLLWLRGYVIKKNWDWKLKDDQLIFKNAIEAEEEGDPTEEQYFPNPYALKILDKLPFREGFDYKDATTDFDDGATTNNLDPIVYGYRLYYDSQVLKLKTDEFMLFNNRHKQDLIVALDSLPCSLNISPLYRQGRLGVLFDISTHPEALADQNNSTTALAPREESPHLSRYNRSDLFVTIAFEEDRYLEARYPADEDVDDVDGIRRRIIDFGNTFEKVTILKGTTTGIGNDHKLESVSSDVLLRDDSSRLNNLAILSHRFYSQNRQVMNLQTCRASAKPDIGKMVLKLNPGTGLEAEVNTVITQVSMDFQPGNVEGVRPCSMTITTASAEFDASPLLRYSNRSERI